MEDTDSVRPMLGEHQDLFGKGTLKSCGTDKGSYSAANRQYLQSLEGLHEFCLQQPGLDLSRLSEGETAMHARLVHRRSGIEPLIGHAKHGGQLGQSRMKHDETTLAAGYGAAGGFNLRQLVRHLLGKEIKVMG
jgi:transposase, IS5 family